jgi:hypothetical protein
MKCCNLINSKYCKDLDESKYGYIREVAGSQPVSAVHNAHGAQMNFGNPTPYLTYACTVSLLNTILPPNDTGKLTTRF